MTVRKSSKSSSAAAASAALLSYKGLALAVALACAGGLAYGTASADAFFLKPFVMHHHANPRMNSLLNAENWLGNAMRVHDDIVNAMGFDFHNHNALPHVKQATKAAATKNAAADGCKHNGARCGTKSPQQPQQQQQQATHFRSANQAYAELLQAQAQRWRCAAHCNTLQRSTLPYEATFAERVVDAKPVSGEYVDAMGGVAITLTLPNVKPSDVSVEVDVDTLTLKASRVPRTASGNPELDALCECSGANNNAADDDEAEAEEVSVSVETDENGVTRSTEQRSTTTRKREEVTRVYQLGAFVPVEHITATITTRPVTPKAALPDGTAAAATAAATAKAEQPTEWVTVLTVRVPNGSRPGVKKVAITSLESDDPRLTAAADTTTAAAATPALTAPVTTATTQSAPTTPTAAITAAAAAAATSTTTASPAATTTSAPATPTAAAAANPGVTVTTDAAGDEVLNL